MKIKWWPQITRDQINTLCADEIVEAWLQIFAPRKGDWQRTMWIFIYDSCLYRRKPCSTFQTRSWSSTWLSFYSLFFHSFWPVSQHSVDTPSNRLSSFSGRIPLSLQHRHLFSLFLHIFVVRLFVWCHTRKLKKIKRCRYQEEYHCLLRSWILRRPV